MTQGVQALVGGRVDAAAGLDIGAVSRRDFIVAVGAAAAALALVPAAHLATRLDPLSPIMAYAFDHEPDVAIWVGNGAEFPIRVYREGAVLETHERVTPATITRIESGYFRAVGIAPPQ